MTSKLYTLALACALGLLHTSAAHAAIVLADDFSTNGDLVGTTPDTGGAWTYLSGTAGSLDVVSGAVNINPVGSEDAEAALTSTQNTTLYAGFTLTVTTQPTSTTGNSTYFAAFQNSMDNYIGRISTLQGSSGSNTFRLGIGDAVNTPTVISGDLTLGINYQIVVRMTQGGAGGDNFTLWVDPVDENSGAIGTTANSGFYADATTFAFRQNGATQGNLLIDNLKVANTSDSGGFNEVLTIPEPTTFSALALGFAVVAFRRRRN